jgi:cytochrome o ubiquinol oxidase subunit II
MTRRGRRLRWLRLAAAIILPLALSACGLVDRGFLAARGPIAAEDRLIFIITLLAMMLVFVPIALGTPLVAWYYRLANRKASYRPKWSFSWILEFFIWVPPTLIVVGLAVMLWRETQRLDPYRQIAAAEPPLAVQVVGFDWKWLFIYPDQHIATVNQLVVPADRPVSMSLTSDTVMQSLLIPQLAGQIYAMAGMRTRLNFEADAPGRFLGENTQFNGMGFQNQNFAVTALPPRDFDRWVQHTQTLGSTLNADAYAQLSRKSSLPHPVAFASVPPGLFDAIVARNHAHKPGDPFVQ